MMRASDLYCNVVSPFGIKKWASSNATSESLNSAQIVMRASDEYCNVMSPYGIKNLASSNATST